MRFERTAGENNPLAGVTLKTAVGKRTRKRFVGNVEERGCMVDARGGPHNDRSGIALGQIERLAHHGERLLRRGRVQNRNLGERGIAARVLLGLRRDRTRVVSNQKNQAAANTHVVQAHQRIGSDVQAHLLAGEQATDACICRAAQKLKGGLLVRRPLDVHIVRRSRCMQLRHRLDDLGRRGSRITGDHVDAGLKGSMSQSLVAHQQLLRHMHLSRNTVSKCADAQTPAHRCSKPKLPSITRFPRPSFCTSR